jgi:sugar lactone lactonase YvrE
MSARRVGGSRDAPGGQRDGPLPLRPDDRRAGHLAPLEADNAATRSNDGRADPFGGFWIGTMGKNAEAGAGALYRYYRGEVVKLRDGYHHP